MGLFDGAVGRGELRLDRARRPAARRAGRARRRRGRGRPVGRRAGARLRHLRPAIRIGGRDLQPGRLARGTTRSCATRWPRPASPVLGAVRRHDALVDAVAAPGADPGRRAHRRGAAHGRRRSAQVDRRERRPRRRAGGWPAAPRSSTSDCRRSIPPVRRPAPLGPDRGRRPGRRSPSATPSTPNCSTAPAPRSSPFDPLRDEQLPAGRRRPGHRRRLPRDARRRARRPTRRCAPTSPSSPRSGAPIAAECAGLLYLARTLDGHPMCGVLDVDAAMTDRLTLGYREAVAPADSVLAPAGTPGARARVPSHGVHAGRRRAPRPGSGAGGRRRGRARDSCAGQRARVVPASALGRRRCRATGPPRFVGTAAAARHRALAHDRASAPTDCRRAARHHGDRTRVAGLVDLAVNVRAGAPPRVAARAARGGRPRALPRSVGRADAPSPRGTAATRTRCCSPPARPRRSSCSPGRSRRGTRGRRAPAVHRARGRAARRRPRRSSASCSTPPFALDPRRVPDDADLVVVGNPTNPTSVLHPARRRCARSSGPAGWWWSTRRSPTASPASRNRWPPTATCRAGRRPQPDQDLGLAGLRAGYLLADPPTSSTQLRAAQPQWPVSAPALAACVACSAPAAVAEAGVWAHELVAQRDHLVALLDRLTPGVRGRPAAPRRRSCSSDTGRPDPDCGCATRGFAVRRGDTFPGLGPHWMRVAVRDQATSTAFAARPKEVLDDRSAGR